VEVAVTFVLFINWKLLYVGKPIIEMLSLLNDAHKFLRTLACLFCNEIDEFVLPSISDYQLSVHIHNSFLQIKLLNKWEVSGELHP
jgi:hypothetical protein